MLRSVFSTLLTCSVLTTATAASAAAPKEPEQRAQQPRSQDKHKTFQAMHRRYLKDQGHESPRTSDRRPPKDRYEDFQMKHERYREFENHTDDSSQIPRSLNQPIMNGEVSSSP